MRVVACSVRKCGPRSGPCTHEIRAVTSSPIRHLTSDAHDPPWLAGFWAQVDGETVEDEPEADEGLSEPPHPGAQGSCASGSGMARPRRSARTWTWGRRPAPGGRVRVRHHA
jgi:hypothetical protein